MKITNLPNIQNKSVIQKHFSRKASSVNFKQMMVLDNKYFFRELVAKIIVASRKPNFECDDFLIQVSKEMIRLSDLTKKPNSRQIAVIKKYKDFFNSTTYGRNLLRGYYLNRNPNAFQIGDIIIPLNRKNGAVIPNVGIETNVTNFLN